MILTNVRLNFSAFCLISKNENTHHFNKTTLQSDAAKLGNTNKVNQEISQKDVVVKNDCGLKCELY